MQIKNKEWRDEDKYWLLGFATHTYSSVPFGHSGLALACSKGDSVVQAALDIKNRSFPRRRQLRPNHFCMCGAVMQNSYPLKGYKLK
jgi:hypothetical protein